MLSDTEKAAGEFLSLLPECSLSPARLAALAARFELGGAELRRGARGLGQAHDLSYAGVRRLAALCLEEAADALAGGGPPLCEISVPAPQCLIAALSHAAGGRWRFVSSALYAQIFLRAFMQQSGPVDFTSCPKRRCGLNRMRERICLDGAAAPGALLSFGALCDECVKTGEALSGAARAFACTLPKSGPRRSERAAALLEGTASELCAALGIRLAGSDADYGLEIQSRIARAGARLGLLSARASRRPLRACSLGLAQAAQLMCPSRWEPLCEALELLCGELEAAPAAEPGRKRLYCFLIPFTRPEAALRFEENGVDLLGSAAFLADMRGAPGGLYGRAAAALTRCAPALPVPDECRLIARAAKGMGCAAYLSGFFAFDRRMGSVLPMQRRILEGEYGLRTLNLDGDFWCENGAPHIQAGRVDALCALLSE